MDLVMNKMGTYWLGQKASKEFGSVGQDFNDMTKSVDGGTKWLVNKIKGKVQKPLNELLKEHDLPLGIFPKDATHYEFDEESKKLTVHIPTICEVGYKDQSVLRFFTDVTATLEKGKLSNIEGIKTYKVFLWIKVTCIACEESKLNFSVGINLSRNRDAYEYQRDGIIVDKF